MNNTSKFLVRKFKVSDLDSIKRISKELHPEWFTEKALKNDNGSGDSDQKWS